MRKLSDRQREQIEQAFAALDPRPHVHLEDLDDFCLDGWFSLNNLRLLVAMLTACEQERMAEEHERL